MSTITRNACAGLLLLLLPANMVMASDRTPLKEGLGADTVQQIQTIGQAVLTAKKNVEPEGTDMQNLRQRLTELQQAVTSLTGPSLNIVKGPSVSQQTNETAAPGIIPGQEQAKRQEDENNKVRGLLNEVRKQRSLVQVKSQNKTGERAVMERTATVKVAELENAVEEALSSQPKERAEKIGKLKERLTISNRALTAQPDTVEKTPTLSTIVHHREQKKSGK